MYAFQSRRIHSPTDCPAASKTYSYSHRWAICQLAGTSFLLQGYMDQSIHICRFARFERACDTAYSTISCTQKSRYVVFPYTKHVFDYPVIYGFGRVYVYYTHNLRYICMWLEKDAIPRLSGRTWDLPTIGIYSIVYECPFLVQCTTSHRSELSGRYASTPEDRVVCMHHTSWHHYPVMRGNSDLS